MDQQIRMLILLPHLGGGGAEHVSALLATHLDPTKISVTMGLVADDHAGAPELPTWVRIHRMGMRRTRNAAVALILLIWRERPQVIFSSMAHLNFLLLILRWTMPPDTSVMVRQNGTATQAARRGCAGRIDRKLYRWLYPKADVILCQSKAMAQDLEENFGLKPKQLRVLPNPVPVDEIQQHVANARQRQAGKCVAPDSPIRLLAVGRLAFEKGIDLLLAALGRLSAQNKSSPCDFELTVLGIGSEEQPLREQARRLGLENRVTFSGHRTDVWDFLAAADIFVLPSRHEGMPNALLEAAAAGLALVATACCEGVVELVGRNQREGVWLADTASAEALAQAIASAITAVKVNRGCRFEHSFVNQFALRQSVEAYQSLIQEEARRRSQ